MQFRGILLPNFRFGQILRKNHAKEFHISLDNLGKKVIQALQSVLEHVLITVAGL